MKTSDLDRLIETRDALTDEIARLAGFGRPAPQPGDPRYVPFTDRVRALESVRAQITRLDRDQIAKLDALYAAIGR